MDRIVDKVKQVLLIPYEELVQVKSEEISITDTIKDYILINFPSLSIFIGLIGRVNDREEGISLGANLLFSAF